MAKYKKCPRCELNYIKVEEDYCPVCKAEMKLTNDDSYNDDLELCPVCGSNFVSIDQVMCDECAKKRSLDDVVDEGDSDLPSKKSKDDWDEESKALDSIEESSMNPIDDDIEVVNFSDLDEEDEEEDDWGDEEDSSVDHFEEDDDFDYSKIDDEDFDEEDDEYEDDYDDDDDFLGKKK